MFENIWIPAYAGMTVEENRMADMQLHTLTVASVEPETDEAIKVMQEILKKMDGKDVGNYKFADAKARLERFKKEADR